ncbi:MAG: hypothetical protein ACXADA_06075 [Candidatus Hodarchaeales archaeon]|jgi:hypothetical protein
MSQIYSKNDRYVAVIEILGGLTIIGFWVGWFLDIFKSLTPDHPFYDTYITFEISFPVPDAWIVILLFTSAHGIFFGKKYGSVLAVAAGAALIFLGLHDATFYLQNGLYQYDLLLIPVNVACLAGGAFLIVWFGRTHFWHRI